MPTSDATPPVRAKGQRFALEVVAMPGHPIPAERRLRAFLKAMRRQAGFQCVRLVQVPSADLQSVEPACLEGKAAATGDRDA
jgi:hypothetical protein